MPKNNWSWQTVLRSREPLEAGHNVRETSQMVARALVAIAFRIAPRGRTGWIHAMAAEAMYVAKRDLLSWTIGCVLAAIKMRCVDMLTLKRDVSGPILVPEILVCFGSLVFAGIQYARILFEIPSLVTHFNSGAVIIAGIAAAAAALLVSIGGLRQIMQRKSMSAALVGWTVACVVLFTLALIAVGGSTSIVRELLLLSVLPILATLHLRYLSSHPALS